MTWPSAATQSAARRAPRMACRHPRRTTDDAPVSTVSVWGASADISTLLASIVTATRDGPSLTSRVSCLPARTGRPLPGTSDVAAARKTNANRGESDDARRRNDRSLEERYGGPCRGPVQRLRLGGRGGGCPRRGHRRPRGRAVHRDHGPLGIGEVHAAPLHGGPRRADRRTGVHRRGGPHDPVGETAHTAS